jgi:hypothetical protein
MPLISRTLAGLITLALFLVGCTSVPPGSVFTQAADGTPAGEIVVIRPAQEEERDEPIDWRWNERWVPSLKNPDSRLAKLISIAPAENPKAYKWVSGYSAIRTNAGLYVVTAQCRQPGFDVDFKLSLATRIGYEYLIQCSGWTAHSATIKTLERRPKSTL